MIVYTNRGLGMIRPHLRFNARPELTIFILESPR
jgi:predicted MPP superfamily phosphohydrolase